MLRKKLKIKKMKTGIYAVVMLSISMSLAAQDATTILETVDKNMSSENRVFESDMIIHGRRSSRTMGSRTYSVGWRKTILYRIPVPGS